MDKDRKGQLAIPRVRSGVRQGRGQGNAVHPSPFVRQPFDPRGLPDHLRRQANEARSRNDDTPLRTRNGRHGPFGADHTGGCDLAGATGTSGEPIGRVECFIPSQSQKSPLECRLGKLFSGLPAHSPDCLKLRGFPHHKREYRHTGQSDQMTCGYWAGGTFGAPLVGGVG